MTQGVAPLACTVRGCGRPLVLRARDAACDRGHTFDRARKGYINLLQPQDRKSLRAGDGAEAVAARSRLLSAGVGSAVVANVVERITGIEPRVERIAELGCGGGDVLGAIAEASNAAGIGFDLSVPGIEHAARRHPAVTWVVANVDRRIPLLDRSVGVVLSFHGRRHAAECARVLHPGGWLIVVVPGAEDLVELREAVLGQASSADRSSAVLTEHRDAFTLVDRATVRERHDLSREQVLDALRGTYRGVRTSQREAVERLGDLAVTVASEILVLRSRETAGKSR
jgi:23S rRNA (guanine745-N1)-methyltransferase